MDINKIYTGSIWQLIDIECRALESKLFLNAMQMRNKFIAYIRSSTPVIDDLALYLNPLTNELTNLGEIMLSFSFISSFCGGKSDNRRKNQ